MQNGYAFYAFRKKMCTQKSPCPVLHSKCSTSIWVRATLLERYQQTAHDGPMKTSINERYLLYRRPPGKPCSQQEGPRQPGKIT